MNRIHVTQDVVDGPKPPIVFTHGWVDDQTVWDGVRSELTDRTTIAWDLPAHGQSATLDEADYTRETMLANMGEIIEPLGQPVVLGGHSLGGYLCLAYALLHPDQVAGLALIAAGPGFRKPEAREQWNDAVDASATKLDIPAGSEALSKHTDSWVIDELETITVPVVAIVGENDRRFQASVGLFEKKLNVIHTAIVDGAGHSVHRKYPEPVAEAIRHLDG